MFGTLCQKSWSQLVEAVQEGIYLRSGKESRRTRNWMRNLGLLRGDSELTELGENLRDGEEKYVASQLLEDHFFEVFDYIHATVKELWFELSDLDLLCRKLWPRITKRSARRRMRNILSVLSVASVVEEAGESYRLMDIP